jgi:hypothetical protein
MRGQEEEAVSLQGGGRGLNKKGRADRLMEARRAEVKGKAELRVLGGRPWAKDDEMAERVRRGGGRGFSSKGRP